MPFGTFSIDKTTYSCDLTPPPPEPVLEQYGRSAFILLKSLCYQDPRDGTVYVIPGEDIGVRPTDERTSADGTKLVMPPSSDPPGKTDLASVPWMLWWLIASYGNHTRAALLHDSLYVKTGAPVKRKVADRLLLEALRENGEKTGTFRHWLMWAAVSAFGNMGKVLGTIFAVHVLFIWGLTIAALVWPWGPSLGQWWWPENGRGAIISILSTLGILGLPFLFGLSWRLLVGVPFGWLLPTLSLAALIVVPLAVLAEAQPWSAEFWTDISPFTLICFSAALFILGLAWNVVVDRRLWGWLWPTALIGLPVALVPCILILGSVAFVWLVDLGAAVAVGWFRRGAAAVFGRFRSSEKQTLRRKVVWEPETEAPPKPQPDRRASRPRAKPEKPRIVLGVSVPSVRPQRQPGMLQRSRLR